MIHDVMLCINVTSCVCVRGGEIVSNTGQGNFLNPCCCTKREEKR